MASFLAIPASIDALRRHLEARIAQDLGPVMDAPGVRLLGETELRAGPDGNHVGLYLHRVTVEESGRNRYLAPRLPGQAPQPELPVRLHLLMIAWTATAANQAPLLAYAMQRVGAALSIDAARIGEADPAWREEDSAQVLPEDMPLENLLRLWEALPGGHRLSAAYCLRTLRLEPTEPVTQGPPVVTVAHPMEVG